MVGFEINYRDVKIMAKRKTIWTEEKIAKYLSEGRGSGELKNYKPWLTNQDFASKGRTHRITSWKTNRMMQLFSDLERNYMYLLDWADNVFDIREQYPLDREVTLKVAERLGIRHPVDQKTNTPLVMTTDFFITLRDENTFNYVARTLKHSEELNDKRVIEKFEIERQYWEDKEIEWGIVTEKDIPRELWENIEFIHNSNRVLNENLIWEDLLYKYLKSSDDQIIVILNNFEKNYKLDDGFGLMLYKSLIARKIVKLNMMSSINLRVDQKEITFVEYLYKEDTVS